jgi:hypothetical protein
MRVILSVVLLGVLLASSAAGQVLQVQSNSQDIATETTAGTIVARLDTLLSSLATEAHLDDPFKSDGPQEYCRASAATPSAVSADNDAQAVWCDLVGRLHIAAEKAEDLASANGDVLMGIAAIRDDTLDVRSTTEGDYEPLHTNASGALWTIDVNSAAILTALQIIDNAETAASHYAYTSAGATEDEHVVVAAPAVLWSVTATNTAATVAYLRCENQDELGDGAPGTDTLAATSDLDLAIPGNTTGSGITFSFARGLSFTVGVKCWITTGEAYSSVAEVGADDVKLLYSYK